MHGSIFTDAQKRDVRAAYRTGIGLSMETAIERIFVLASAGGAHGKDTHGRLVPIIGHILNDSEARATVGAVNEGIVIASVGGIKQLLQAILAGAGIGRDQRTAFCPRFALHDQKVCLMAQGHILTGERNDLGQRRKLLSQRLLKSVNGLTSPFNFNRHAESIVQDKPDEAVANCVAIHERTKADSLHDALYSETLSLQESLVQIGQSW